MKVFIVHGSPRKQGNSSFLAGKLVEFIGSPDVQEVYLSGLHYKGCSGCMACRKNAAECVMRDGLSPVLSAIKQADVTVLASPVYQEYVNGDMKCLIDRFFSYLAPDHFSRLAAGETDIPTRIGSEKTVITLLAQGQSEALYPYLNESLTAVMKEAGFAQVHIARCCRLNSAKDSRDREDLFAMLKGIAEQIRDRYA